MIDVLAILIAIVGAIISFYSIVEQKKSVKEQIEADFRIQLRSSRLDRLSEIRKHATELYSIYYAILKGSDNLNVLEKMIDAKRHSDILRLNLLNEGDQIIFDQNDLSEDNNKNETEEYEIDEDEMYLDTDPLDYILKWKSPYNKEILKSHENSKEKQQQLCCCIDDVYSQFEEFYINSFNRVSIFLERLYDAQVAFDDETAEDYSPDGRGFYILVRDDVKECESKYKKVISHLKRLTNNMEYYISLYSKIEFDEIKNQN